MSREIIKNEFIKTTCKNLQNRISLTSDASFRRYERIVTDKNTYILMDAPPDLEDIKAFINIDNYLYKRGFSSPKIFSQDIENGFLLLEDLGDDSFTKVLLSNSSFSEEDLYKNAINVLIELANCTLPKIMPDYDDKLLLQECELFTKWYLPNIQDGIINKDLNNSYLEIWSELLAKIKIVDDVVVLRDYHADNLIWLPKRDGIKKIGLLDFQDAVIGSPVYDIVSLLEDARRDVSLKTVKSVINYYIEKTGFPKNDFEKVYAILAAQRNLKIIGIFSRLAIRDRKPRYINFLPRVWKSLENSLLHPELNKLKNFIDKNIDKKMRLSSAFKYRQEGVCVSG